MHGIGSRMRCCAGARHRTNGVGGRRDIEEEEKDRAQKENINVKCHYARLPRFVLEKVNNVESSKAFSMHSRYRVTFRWERNRIEIENRFAFDGTHVCFREWHDMTSSWLPCDLDCRFGDANRFLGQSALHWFLSTLRQLIHYNFPEEFTTIQNNNRHCVVDIIFKQNAFHSRETTERRRRIRKQKNASATAITIHSVKAAQPTESKPNKINKLQFLGDDKIEKREIQLFSCVFRMPTNDIEN